MKWKILPVGKILVRTEIADIPFKCDLKKCKGACCTIDSEFGAPLKRNEIEAIEEILESVIVYLSEKHKEEIESNGFYEIISNELLIRSRDNKECVFVYFENDVAKCAIEKAFVEGKTDFRKPISCHLFPIRISDFGGDVLRFEKFDECKPAIDAGKNYNITVAEYCEEPLKRLYGKNWYSQFKEAIGR
ncbi:MAG: DUF3109 family protein [Ignavibacteriaceae bacterium]|nr:DUF3109 family protein [Ignavibacteriaceae bacterium]